MAFVKGLQLVRFFVYPPLSNTVGFTKDSNEIIEEAELSMGR